MLFSLAVSYLLPQRWSVMLFSEMLSNQQVNVWITRVKALRELRCSSIKLFWHLVDKLNIDIYS